MECVLRNQQIIEENFSKNIDFSFDVNNNATTINKFHCAIFPFKAHCENVAITIITIL